MSDIKTTLVFTCKEHPEFTPIKVTVPGLLTASQWKMLCSLVPGVLARVAPTAPTALTNLNVEEDFEVVHGEKTND